MGADNIAMHLDNIAWYQKAALVRDETEQDLKALLAEIRKLEDRYFPKDLKEWLRLKERWSDGKLGWADYLKRMSITQLMLEPGI